MLSRVALSKGDRCGGLFDDRALGFLPPQSGPAAYQAILSGLYDAQSRWRETDFGPMFANVQVRQQKRALVIVLSDLVDADTSERYRYAMASLTKRHVVVFAALQTPLLDELIHKPVQDAADVARIAVAMRLKREREKSLYALRRSGVFVLDVKPTDLTVPLINQYISLRERDLV